MPVNNPAHRFADAIVLEEALISWKVRLALVLTIGLTVLCGVWSVVTRIDEAVKTSGQFIPQGLVFAAQASEAGLLAALYVKEGDVVEKGALLAQMSNAAALADQKQSQARMAGLQARRIRLQAFLNHTEADFSSIDPSYGDVIRDQASLLRTQQLSQESSLSVLDTQLAQKKSECEQLEERIHTAQARVDVDSAMLALQESLARKNLVSKVTLLNAKRGQLSTQSESNQLIKQLEKARQALDEVQKRRQTFQAESRQQASDELGQINNDIAQTQALLTRLQERIIQLEIRTPVAGVVQGIRTRTIGAVLREGDALMQVVPLGAEILLDVRIAPRDIGFIHPGQPVVIKVASYDFQRFGTLGGELVSVSPATEVDPADPEQLHYYRGLVRPVARFVGTEERPIMPGMGAEADIVTGHRSVLVYLLKPLMMPGHGGSDLISRAEAR
ncbi:MAG: HlyD family type I secretion periplasmic adaptor subunit [Magnetococcales bacterium]|nr:HlyD family type I secretion periplasmic adaptor subunit [Magnetococcales bacterium]